MIRQIDEVILMIFQQALSQKIDPKNITTGPVEKPKEPAILIRNTRFSVTDTGIGGYGGIKKEEVTDEFNPDGKTQEFTLSSLPLRPLIAVEHPKGTPKGEPDDYLINYETGRVTFRIPPEKGTGKIRVLYWAGHSVAEIITLQVNMDYSFIVFANDTELRDDLALEIVKVLHREQSAFDRYDITNVRLIRGYLQWDQPPGLGESTVIDCQIEATVPIEMKIPPIEYIEITKKG
jgi:hypothetical protein